MTAHPITTLALALALAIAGASSANAADSVYWTSAIGDTISHANLDGSGGASDLDTGGGLVEVPAGVVLDPASNHVYWANFGGNSIWRANLDGTGDPLQIDTGGATVNGPFGLALDQDTNSIYWSNYGGTTISRANLDGTGDGHDLDTTGVTVSQPSALVIHPPSGRVGWVNTGTHTIARTNGNEGPGAVYMDTGVAPIQGPFGLAIDVGTGRLYWSNATLGSIAQSRLDGSDAGTLPTGGPMLGPSAIAIDPETNSIYWAAYAGTNSITRANLDGTGERSVLDTSGATISMPLGMALLKAPGGIEPPEISGGGTVGQQLTCSRGTWEADSSLRSLYRAPASYAYQWTLEGSDIPDATGTSYTPAVTGSYACRVTASNHAGGTDQESAPVSVSGGAGGFSVAPLTRAFGARVADAGPSPVGSFTLSNAGGTSVDVAGVTLQGPDAGQFAIVQNACTAPIPAFSGTCTVDVVFNPTSVGDKQAALRLEHSAPGSPTTVGLSGTATSPQAGPSSPNPSPLGGGPPSRAPALTAAVATVFSTTLVPDRRGRLPVILSCAGVGTCSGAVKVRTAKRVRTGRGKRKRVLALGSKHYAGLAGGSSRTVKVKLKREARQLLRKTGKLRVVIELVQPTVSASALPRPRKGVVHARDGALPW